MIAKNWLKTALILLVLGSIAWLSPQATFDPWSFFSLKKIAKMIFALALIQTLGSLMIQLLGGRTGAILSGFLGGLLSSTATTATLARKSVMPSKQGDSTETITFLSSTLAMLLEASAIIIFGTEDVHPRLLIIFLGPTLSTLALIIHQSRFETKQVASLKNTQLEFLPLLKLSAFVLGILTFSKLLLNIFGKNGLLAMTFIMSLFELHGSVIANVQLHDSGAITVTFLGGLIAISIASSYISKVFLVITLGSSSLKTKVVKLTSVLLLSTVTSWLLFRALI